MGRTLMEVLEDAGYPQEQMFHHNSDLYVYITPLTKEVVGKWFDENGICKEAFLSSFADQITGKRMYDIAFQYTPFWSEEPEAER